MYYFFLNLSYNFCNLEDYEYSFRKGSGGYQKNCLLAFVFLVNGYFSKKLISDQSNICLLQRERERERKGNKEKSKQYRETENEHENANLSHFSSSLFPKVNVISGSLTIIQNFLCS